MNSVTSVDVRARRESPEADPRLAVYPIAQTGNLNTKSYVDSASAKPLNKPMIDWFVDKLLAKPDDKKDTRLDLINAKLNGLPPVTIIHAQIDPLRGRRSATGGPRESGREGHVKVDRKNYEGVTHEFFGMATVVKDAADAQKYGGRALKASFGK